MCVGYVLGMCWEWCWWVGLVVEEGRGGGGGRRKLVSKAYSIRLYIIIPAASQRT